MLYYRGPALNEGPEELQGHSEGTWALSRAKAPDWHYPNELQLQP